MQRRGGGSSKETYYLRYFLQNFDPTTLADDIALLHLDTDATMDDNSNFRENFVRLIRVPQNAEEFFDSVACFVAGFEESSKTVVIATLLFFISIFLFISHLESNFSPLSCRVPV